MTLYLHCIIVSFNYIKTQGMSRFLLLLGVLISVSGYGQITVGNNTFPVSGDTLKTIIDGMPDDIDLLEPGANKNWIFTSLQSPFTQEVIFEDPSEGSQNVPEASMVVKSGEVLERYYKSYGNKIEEIAYKTVDPITNQIEVFAYYVEPVLFRKAPLEYGYVFEHESKIPFTISSEIIPDTLLEMLPIVPDSIRIILVTSRFDSVDAWGSLELPSANYEVLREKSISYTTTEIEAFVFGTWIEVPTDLIDPTGELLPSDTTYSYQFYSNDSKEIIAAVTVDEKDNASSVTYKADDIKNDIPVVQQGQTNVFIYPNPSYGDVRFELVSFKPGTYRIDVRSVIGKKIWSKHLEIKSANSSHKENLSFLPKGTFLYSIVSETGETIATKRLVIMKP
jgi:hypothetical protein